MYVWEIQNCKNCTDLLNDMISSNTITKTNHKDIIQTNLMCNMPDMAIHKFRCDTTIDKKNCPRVEIIPVDNRHYDLGFIRMEVFEIWNENKHFKKIASNFHEAVLKDIEIFAKQYMI